MALGQVVCKWHFKKYYSKLKFNGQNRARHSGGSWLHTQELVENRLTHGSWMKMNSFSSVDTFPICSNLALRMQRKYTSRAAPFLGKSTEINKKIQKGKCTTCFIYFSPLLDSIIFYFPHTARHTGRGAQRMLKILLLSLQNVHPHCLLSLWVLSVFCLLLLSDKN